jgi:hypothetical protein
MFVVAVVVRHNQANRVIADIAELFLKDCRPRTSFVIAAVRAGWATSAAANLQGLLPLCVSTPRHYTPP